MGDTPQVPIFVFSIFAFFVVFIYFFVLGKLQLLDSFFFFPPKHLFTDFLISVVAPKGNTLLYLGDLMYLFSNSIIVSSIIRSIISIIIISIIRSIRI